MRTEPHGTWRRVRRANGANTAESIRAHTTHARRAWHVACGMPRIGSFSRLLFDEWVVHARCVAPHLRQRVPLPPGRARGVVKAQHDRCQCCRHVGTASAACSANVPHLRSTLWISLAGRGVLLRSLSNQTPRSTCAGPAPYVVGGEREGPGGRRATAQRTEGAAQQVPATAPLATGTALAHQGNFTILSREFKHSDTTAPRDDTVRTPAVGRQRDMYTGRLSAPWRSTSALHTHALPALSSPPPKRSHGHLACQIFIFLRPNKWVAGA